MSNINIKINKLILKRILYRSIQLKDKTLRNPHIRSYHSWRTRVKVKSLCCVDDTYSMVIDITGGGNVEGNIKTNENEAGKICITNWSCYETYMGSGLHHDNSITIIDYLVERYRIILSTPVILTNTNPAKDMGSCDLQH